MWTVFRGYEHSFHIACILPDIRDFPICKAALLSKVKELGQTANTSVSNAPVPSAAEESDEDEYNQLADYESETINIDTLSQRIRQWRTLESRAVMTMMASHNLPNLVTYFWHKGSKVTQSYVKI